jgi:hypothetical protein
VLLETFDKSNLIEFISKQIRPKVWKILIIELIFLLEIQTNFKNWVWRGKSIEDTFVINTCAT